MSEQKLIPLALESATHYLTGAPLSPGQLIGGVIGSSLGVWGAFVGGTVGRMVERKWSD